jgi:hypothetical protein
MDSMKLKENWNVVAGKLKQQYADLIDDEVLLQNGKEEELSWRTLKIKYFILMVVALLVGLVLAS